jgi:hypothetical protein
MWPIWGPVAVQHLPGAAWQLGVPLCAAQLGQVGQAIYTAPPALAAHSWSLQQAAGAGGAALAAAGGVAAVLPGVTMGCSRDPRPGGSGLLPRMSDGEYNASAKAAYLRTAQRWEESTLKERERQCKEFSQWLQQLPASRGSGSWQGCVPTDILAYMEGAWLPAHGTTELLDGSLGTSPSYMQSSLSHLSTAFKLMGRRASWGTAPEMHCNPVDSEEVKVYLGAYRKQYARAGHQARAARPWDLAALGQLLQRMDSVGQQREGKGLETALRLRDQAALCFMADCGKRGEDCGQMHVWDLSRVGGAVLAPGAFHPAEGEMWECRMFSKTRKEARGPPIRFRYTGCEPALLTNFLWRLQQYLTERVRLDDVPRRYLFNPSGRAGVRFMDEPLRSRALQGRIKEHLRQHGLEHQTLHGLRRGLRQDLAAAGEEQDAAMKALDIRSKRTDRLYSDSSRPVRV